MKWIQVRLTTVGLAALIIGASLIFAWAVNQTPARIHYGAGPPDGRVLFDARCGGCHPAADLVDRLRAAPDLGTKARELDAFLAGHGHSTPEENRAIATYLVELARR
jgi:mono/diheme cytochrome c family protein